jgi:hypothetical protein
MCVVAARKFRELEERSVVRKRCCVLREQAETRLKQLLEVLLSDF